MTHDAESRPESVREPKQDRSKATLARILDSARKAMEEKDFDAATLSEVAEGAGVTVGAFYGRFPDKAALLRLLEQEAYEDLGAALSEPARLEPAWSGPPRELVRRLLGELARSYREHRGVFRTILLKSRSDPERQRRRMDFTSEFLRVGVARLQAAVELEHPPSERAWRVALLFATSALRDAILFDEDWWVESADEDRDELLVEELTSAMLAYLGIPPD